MSDFRFFFGKYTEKAGKDGIRTENQIEREREKSKGDFIIIADTQ